jgi:mono/diheme cytochrome c family protein
MKKILKPLAYVVIIIAIVIIAIISYVVFALPNVGPAENIKVELTPQRIERGKYLATNVAVCLDCHTQQDWSKFGHPIDTNRLGAGGEKFDSGAGFPGNVTVPNITPYKISSWTDGELFRAITTGVKKDGTPIFPLMPWPYYSKMDKEDIYDIIAYIRTLKPVVTDHPRSTLDFPLNIIVHTMPQKATLGTRPDPADSIKYGEYLVQSSACQECHSQDDKGKYLPGLQFAGGKQFGVNGHALRSANITPDVSTGIGSWTKQQFIARFKMFKDVKTAAYVEPADFQTIMPWWQYGKMTEADLGAIYAFLRTVKPVKNSVIKFSVK